jgi:hypothetical protein
MAGWLTCSVLPTVPCPPTAAPLPCGAAARGGDSISLSTTRGCFLADRCSDGVMSPRDRNGMSIGVTWCCWPDIAARCVACRCVVFYRAMRDTMSVEHSRLCPLQCPLHQLSQVQFCCGGDYDRHFGVNYRCSANLDRI